MEAATHLVDVPKAVCSWFGRSPELDDAVSNDEAATDDQQLTPRRGEPAERDGGPDLGAQRTDFRS